MIYHYMDKELECGWKENLAFSWSKTAKIYQLHILTMLCYLPFSIKAIIDADFAVIKILKECFKYFCNILLIQDWIPYADFNVSLNGVAWFLSAMTFLYFMFPWILRWVKQLEKRQIVLFAAAIFIVQFGFCFVLLQFLDEKSKVYIWFQYTNPVFRLADFTLGCFIGTWHKKYGIRALSRACATALEVIGTALCAFIYVYLLNLETDSALVMALRNGTTMYLLPSVIWVSLFAFQHGWLTTLLNNRALRYVGDISPYLFLIHYVVIQYFDRICEYILFDFVSNHLAVLICLELLISIALSVVYKKLIDYKKHMLCSEAHENMR